MKTRFWVRTRRLHGESSLVAPVMAAVVAFRRGRLSWNGKKNAKIEMKTALLYQAIVRESSYYRRGLR